MVAVTSTVPPSYGVAPDARGPVGQVGQVEHVEDVTGVTGVDEVVEVDDVDEEFVTLVYSDPEWLRAEFDAIIAAAWSSPPPPPPARDKGADKPPDRPQPVPSPPPRGRWRAGSVACPRDRGAQTRSPPDISGSECEGGPLPA
ncbi:MAG TPA: hypothetical protein VGN48_06060 [Pedococcus sp.]|jgi:hypothetical protein|nr:hypothetical protein [Pedococcus sp.]